MSHFELTQKIIELSVADTWDEAKLEWSLHDVFKEEEPDTCLCGKFPILENCILRNDGPIGARHEWHCTIVTSCFTKMSYLPC